MSAVPALAAWLRTLEPAELAHLLRRRAIDARRIGDWLDLAERLLDPANVRHALGRLDRYALAALAAAAEVDTGATVTAADVAARLHEWGLPADVDVEARLRSLASDGLTPGRRGHAVLEPVAEILAAVTEGSGAARWAREPAPPCGTRPEAADEAHAAERSFAVVHDLAHLVRELQDRPARELSKGGLAAGEERRLGHTARTDVPVLLEIAEAAGLVSEAGRRLHADARAEAWLRQQTATRWRIPAEAWWLGLPGLLRDGLASRRVHWGSGLDAYLRWAYPLADDLDTDLARWRRHAEELGVSVDGHPTRQGASLLAADADAAQEQVARALPAEVGRVYLQHDLSVIAPGPLTPAVDARLRELAEVESSGLAPGYRITAARVEAALASGSTASSILEFFTDISAAPLPQPLEYLVTESAARFGRVRVRAADAQALASVVHSTDAALLDTIEVDRSLAPLRLRRDTSGERLITAQAPEVVQRLLADARYPAALEDDAGRLLPPDQAPSGTPTASGDAIDELVTRLTLDREVGTGDDERDWLERELQTAVKAHATLVVTVDLPDGSSAEYPIEPTGVGAGRVRGLDRDAEIERTLPLASIRGVRSA